MNNQYLIEDERDLENLAKDVLERFPEYKHATVLALQGDLGAGKTTFTKNLARILGITESVTSPTFVIQKSFDIENEAVNFKKLIHIDSYRLDLASELEHLGWSDILNQKENLIVIEWPERVAEILPREYILLKFEHVDETTRKVTVEEIKNAD